MQMHQRQFVVGPRPVKVNPDWVIHQIPSIGYLCHSPELRIATATDSTGTVWYLLGLAVQADQARLDPVYEIAHASDQSIEHISHSWAGRWVLIGAQKVYMDSAGLLGCFYGFKERDDTGKELWVSSSAALLASVIEADTTLVRVIEHRKGIDWYPGPHSAFKSVRRLLPSQILSFPNGAVHSRQLVSLSGEPVSYETLLDQLQQYLVTTVQQAAKLATTVWVPLTAGYDSRLLLATARYAGIPIRTYTHSHKHVVKDADLTIPPKLARIAGVKHVMRYEGAFRSDLAELYDQHTGGHCVDRDRYYFVHEYFNQFHKGDLILRGGVFDLGHHKWGRRYPPSVISPTVPEAEYVLNGFNGRGGVFDLPQDQALVQAFQEWIDWTAQMPQEALDWRDRLYLEQRLGGWLSSIEQSLDLIEADRFYAANSHLYFSLILQIPEAIRRPGQHHVDLIKRMAPELLVLPFNPPNPKPVWKRVKKMVKDTLRSLNPVN